MRYAIAFFLSRVAGSRRWDFLAVFGNENCTGSSPSHCPDGRVQDTLSIQVYTQLITRGVQCVYFTVINRHLKYFTTDVFGTQGHKALVLFVESGQPQTRNTQKSDSYSACVCCLSMARGALTSQRPQWVPVTT